MMRALWTSASGMNAQLTHIDVITNNLANVNTHGFKRERVNFKSLLYENIQRANLDPVNMTGRSVNLQVGHGVRVGSVTRNFSQGMLQRTDRFTDFGIEGNGFFEIRREDGSYLYTRDGSFSLMPVEGGLVLATSDGFPVMSTDGDIITIPLDVNIHEMTITDAGTFMFMDEDGLPQELGYTLRIVQFPNVQGLLAAGGNAFRETVASGAPLLEYEGEVNNFSRILSGVLEMSNVQIAEEMIGLITTQRAFDVNSRGITTSDEMLQTASQLRR